MKTYARIDENNIIRELLTLDDSADISTMFHPSLVWKDVTGFAVSEGLQYDPATGLYSSTPEPLPDPVAAQAALKEALKASAQSTLDKSDTTLLRCYEAGVAVPVEWATYRGQLREIVSGKSSATVLPVRPVYPV